MASKLKNRQKAEIARALAAQSSEQPAEPERQPEDCTDEFAAASNIASKIAQRRLPRRTPTSHVKGVSGELIRRRLSKTGEMAALGNVASKRLTFEASIEKSFDDSAPRPPPPIRQLAVEKEKEKPKSPGEYSTDQSKVSHSYFKPSQ